MQGVLTAKAKNCIMVMFGGDKQMNIKQKKVLALHDLACFGRSSLVPITSILSVQGHQCVPVPTAIFSTHTAINGWTSHDLTQNINPILSHFENLNLKFDAIYSGFLGCAEQIDCVINSAKLKADNGYFLVDPVMGDNGKVYKTYTPEMTQRMSELCHIADCITPNVTESAILLGKSPDTAPKDKFEAESWSNTLANMFNTDVVLTGIHFSDDELTVACTQDGKTVFFSHECINAFFPGTGDIFTSVLLGQILCSKSLYESALCASDFVKHCIIHTANKNPNILYGVEFEPLLSCLIK